MLFHSPRYRSPNPSLYIRLWQFHDDHPLPHKLNRAGRYLVYVGRRIRHAITRRSTGEDAHSKPVPRDAFLSARQFSPMRFEDAVSWFQRIHEANEAVYNGNGAWYPQPYAGCSGRGIPIEEVALRIPGYLSAYRATNEAIYLERAESAGKYLLRERLFADGHILLQGHQVIDFCYSIAGVALLELWEQDRSRTEYFEAARKIGDRLVECHIAGAIDHACLPVQFLGPLYRHTGDVRYLKAGIKRVFRRAVPFQLPTGDWDGDQGCVWYHSINLRSLIAAYVSMPFTLEYQAKKDRLARSIVAAANWFLVQQDASGVFPLHRNGGDWASQAASEVATFDGNRFHKSPISRGYFGHAAYEIDTLVALYEHLSVIDILPALHGYAALIAGTNRVWRLEFNTLGAGRYLGLLADLRMKSASQLASEQRSPRLISDNRDGPRRAHLQ